MRIPRLGPDVRRFFVGFSRFEYALKRSGHVRARGRNGDAEVDWSGFARSISAAFDDAIKSAQGPDLASAVQLLSTDPPRKLVLMDRGQGERLYWKRAAPNGNDLDGLLVLVRRVRNNLFHGEKPETSAGGDRRGLELVKASQVIIDACTSLEPEVRRYLEMYAEPIPRIDE